MFWFYSGGQRFGIYDAFSSFSIRVDAIDNVEIEVAGDALVDLEAFGDANAGGGISFTVNDAAIFSLENEIQNDIFVQEFHSDLFTLGLNDTARWTSNSFGDVSPGGEAFSEVFNDALIDLISFGEGSATISWLYTIEASTSIDNLFTESAEALAFLLFLDELDQGFDAVYDEIFVSEFDEDSFSVAGVWDFGFSDSSSTITGFLETFGTAQAAPAPVPEPATMLFFGVGLVGLAGSRLARSLSDLKRYADRLYLQRLIKPAVYVA